MSGNSVYLEFDDRNPAFTYGPGWSNLTDPNAQGSTLSYTSQETNVTIQFYGETLWLFGAIGRTQDWNQPVSRYTLDNRYIATITADVRNETSYHEPFAYFANLDPSYHTLVVENTKEGATLFLDYYLVDPIPPDELSKSMGNLQTGGMPLTTSISENPELISGSGLSGDAATGNITGAVVGGILVALLLAVVAIILWGRRANAKRSHYRSAAVYEVLCDEFKSEGDEQKRDPATSTNNPCSSNPSTAYDTLQNIPQSPPSRLRAMASQSSLYSLSSDRRSILAPSRHAYFPLPSEFQSHSLLSKSGSKSSLHSNPTSSTRSSGPSSPREQRPLR